MTTVAELLAETPAGGVWLLEVSFDDFATVAYRWSSISVTVGSDDYDGRIASLTPITRSFGRDNLPAASTVKLRISNSDFAADWMIDRTTVATQLLKARFRLSVFLYESRSYGAADALTGATQPIGVFNCLNEPELMDTAIDLTLADDSLGRLAEPATTPTVREWLESSALLPYLSGSPIAAMDWDVPLPLVFGQGEYNVTVPAYKAIANFEEWPTLRTVAQIQTRSVAAKTFPIVVCVSREGNYFGDAEITRLQGTFRDDVEGKTEARGYTIEIPRTFKDKYPASGNATGLEYEIWRPRRSAPFTKGDRTWQVIYIDFDVDLYAMWFHQKYDQVQLTPNGGAVTGNNTALPVTSADASSQTFRGAIMGAFSGFTCNGTPLSTMTVRPVPTAEDTLGASRLLVDMIRDLIGYYSRALLTDLDVDAFERAAKARVTVWGAGIVQPARPRPLASTPRYGWVSPNPRDGIVGILRTALGEMCGSCDADLFMTKEGLYSISTNVFDYEAITGDRVDVDEARTQRVRIRTPSQGERWAPYNRVNLIGPGGAPFGPYDNQDAIDEWGVVLPRTIQAKWNARLWGEGSAVGASTVWQYRSLESKVRPAIRFLADREYLGLELGDYFTFTHTRGGAGAVFQGTIFRVEAQRIDPLTLAVEIDAVWADDLLTAAPFLLDDEEFLVRWDGVGGGTLQVTDDSPIVQLSGGGFTGNDVAPNDILVLKDSTQAENVFTRYREIRIVDVLADDQVELDPADLDFDAPSGFSLAEGDWYVTRGAITYPTSSSDPANYPNGGDLYGKCSDVTDLYSDTSGANKLLDG